MNKRHIYYCLLLAILVTGLYNIFMPRSAYHPEQLLKVGQIAEKDIIAPFNFPILKTKEQLEKERAAVIKTLKPVYRLSDEVQFNAVKKLDNLFIPLIETKAGIDTAGIRNFFKTNGVSLSVQSAKQLRNQNLDKGLYSYLQTGLNSLYQKGIYDEIPDDTVNVFSNGDMQLKSRDNLVKKQSAIEQLLSGAPNSSFTAVLDDILPTLIMPNLILDTRLFNDLVDKTFSTLPKTTGTINKNEIIVRSNSRVTEEDLNKIQSLITAGQSGEVSANPWKALSLYLSLFLYFFILGLILLLFYKLFYAGLLDKKFHFFPLIAGLAVNAVMAILNNQILGLQTLLIPYSMTVIASAILIDIPFATFYNFLSFASIYPFVNWETFSPLVLVLATSGVILLMGRLNDKHQYFSIWIYLLITTIALTLVFALYKQETVAVFLLHTGYAFISSTLTVILMLFIVPYLERKWNLATKQQLLELLDFNHPLLKKLATDAPGTYYHSLVVGNLAERASEAIGANSLLARVGSYYHDIGKIANPDFFTENNPDSSAIHDKLEPAESAAGIRNHVEEGITLAQKYNIPPSVVDIILQHHGTGYIRYFLDKAEKTNQKIDLEQYKYGGPRPKSKEASVVMIADIVESVAKSWDNINPEDIKKILNDTVLRLIREGQFDDSPITLNDLVKVKESMIPILESIYRKRQQYPESDDNE